MLAMRAVEEECHICRYSPRLILVEHSSGEALVSYSLVGLPIWTSSPVLETLRTLDIASLECWVRL